jgi:hypothetical protein
VIGHADATKGRTDASPAALFGEPPNEKADVMNTGSGGSESPNTLRGFAVVCTWAVVGLILTGAVIWLGFDVIGSFP